MTRYQVPFVIAEAGVNHNGDLGRAREMIAVAKEAGADAVKFQAFSAEGLVAGGAAATPYQQRNTGVTTQLELLDRLAFERSQFEELAAQCEAKQIEFLCTPFDVGFVGALVEMGMKRIKIASGELTNVRALRVFASFDLPIFLSTGMATLDEVRAAVLTLHEAGARDVTILHCTSLYPAPDDAINLRAMQTMANAFGLPVGYSDHSLGDHVAIAAVALGAVAIEKHFTLDRSLPGPDHCASMEPSELAKLIGKLRATAEALGDGVKRPAPGEAQTAELVRRSWHAQRDLPAGTALSAEDIVLKRPAHGLPPGTALVGRHLSRARLRDDPIRAEDIL